MLLIPIYNTITLLKFKNKINRKKLNCSKKLIKLK